MTALSAPLLEEASIAELLEIQAGTLHLSQLNAADRALVRRAVRSGRWQSPARGVAVNHNGPLTELQRVWVALHAADPQAAVSGPSALNLAGLKGFPADGSFVTVPCGRRSVRLDWVTTKYSRFLGADDVHPVLLPRRTRQPRSFLDSAAWATTDTRARAVLLAGVQQRLVTPGQLREALPRRGPCLRHPLILETIEDAAGGIASVPEKEFDVIRRACGLPEPTRQRVLQRPNGRHYLDVYDAKYALGIEIDGMQHLDVLSWDADLDRQNEIVIGEDMLLRFSSYTVRHRQQLLASVMTRAFIRRGWPGP